MPELPEVEATAQYLRERLIGHRIQDASLLWPRTLATGGYKTFQRQLIGCEVTQVSRRGKFVVINLSNSGAPLHLLFHLRMSGSLDVVSRELPVEPHDRLVIELDRKRDLRFNDIRKFGRCYLVEDISEIVGGLGLEPLLSTFSKEALFAILKNRKGRIKSVLLDQTAIAGIGNIYADEALWLSKIHPTKAANTITKLQNDELWVAIQAVLQEAIGKLGTDFGDGIVDGGMYTPKAYGRNGKPCERCGKSIERIVVGQRSTHFCPKCQGRKKGS